MSEKAEITRYPNRRLYDRSSKKYVTLGDIEAMVLSGQDVRVCDSKSDEDLTRVILMQIILERHPERVKMFPVAFLHAILRCDQLALDWLTVYFGQATTFMGGITGSPGASLVPGMDLWKSFMPDNAKRGDDATNVSAQSGHDEDSDPAEELQQVPAPEDLATEDLAAKLAEMEHRIKELEGASTTDDPSTSGQASN